MFGHSHHYGTDRYQGRQSIPGQRFFGPYPEFDVLEATWDAHYPRILVSCLIAILGADAAERVQLRWGREPQFVWWLFVADARELDSAGC
jgi:hypothetical protein